MATERFEYQELVDEVRDFHSDFDAQKLPTGLVLRFLTRKMNFVVGEVAKINPDIVAQQQEIPAEIINAALKAGADGTNPWREIGGKFGEDEEKTLLPGLSGHADKPGQYIIKPFATLIDGSVRRKVGGTLDRGDSNIPDKGVNDPKVDPTSGSYDPSATFYDSDAGKMERIYIVSIRTQYPERFVKQVTFPSIAIRGYCIRLTDLRLVGDENHGWSRYTGPLYYDYVPHYPPLAAVTPSGQGEDESVEDQLMASLPHGVRSLVVLSTAIALAKRADLNNYATGLENEYVGEFQRIIGGTADVATTQSGGSQHAMSSHMVSQRG